MDCVITTIYFDGQFWAALIEKIQADGSILIGRYIFGNEPNNNDVLYFYLNLAYTIPLLHNKNTIRIKNKKTIKEHNRITKKSLNEYKTLQQEFLQEKKIEKKNAYRLEKQALYELKKQKKKLKK